MFKNLPPWLRGGLLGSLCAVLLYLTGFFLLYLDTIGAPQFFEDLGYGILFPLFVFPGMWFSWLLFKLPPEYGIQCLGEECLGIMLYSSIIPAVIHFFILGAMINHSRHKKLEEKK